MVTKFERPVISFAPQVYSTFSSKNMDTNEDEEFYIQDLPGERFEEAAKFMVQHYTKEEPFQVAYNVPEDTLMDFYRTVFKQKVTLVCFKKGTDELVALNALSVKTKGKATIFKIDDTKFMKLREAFAFINGQFDVFDHYNVNYYLYAHGLAVKPEYRGRGIAVELLKTRVPLMNVIGLTVTTSLFTTKGSQVAAFKVGYTEDFAITYEIIKKKFPTVDFSCANSPDCKLLSLKI